MFDWQHCRRSFGLKPGESGHWHRDRQSDQGCFEIPTGWSPVQIKGPTKFSKRETLGDQREKFSSEGKLHQHHHGESLGWHQHESTTVNTGGKQGTRQKKSSKTTRSGQRQWKRKNWSTVGLLSLRHSIVMYVFFLTWTDGHKYPGTQGTLVVVSPEWQAHLEPIQPGRVMSGDGMLCIARPKRQSCQAWSMHYEERFHYCDEKYILDNFYLKYQVAIIIDKEKLK